MKKRIQFIIDELLKENFITVKEDDNVIILEENEEGGESRLKFETKSSNTMTIENIDKKHTEMYFFKDTSKFSMYKRVDHIIMDNVDIQNNKWDIYLIEMKSNIADNTWMEVKGKFRASYLFIKAFAAMIEININNVYMYTTYRKAHFESCTIPSSKRIRTGTRNVPHIEEFEGDKFAINLGEYIKFKHIPILMRDDITEHRLIGEYEVSD